MLTDFGCSFDTSRRYELVSSAYVRGCHYFACGENGLSDVSLDLYRDGVLLVPADSVVGGGAPEADVTLDFVPGFDFLLLAGGFSHGGVSLYYTDQLECILSFSVKPGLLISAFGFTAAAAAGATAGTRKPNFGAAASPSTGKYHQQHHGTTVPQTDGKSYVVRIPFACVRQAVKKAFPVPSYANFKAEVLEFPVDQVLTTTVFSRRDVLEPSTFSPHCSMNFFNSNASQSIYVTDLAKAAEQQEKFDPLKQSARDRVSAGFTSAEEVQYTERVEEYCLSPSAQLEDGGRRAVACAYDSGSNKYLLIADNLGRVGLYCFHSLRCIHLWRGYREAQVAFLGTGAYAAILATRRCLLEVWDLGTLKRVRAWNLANNATIKARNVENQNLHDEILPLIPNTLVNAFPRLITTTRGHHGGRGGGSFGSEVLLLRKKRNGKIVLHKVNVPDGSVVGGANQTTSDASEAPRKTSSSQDDMLEFDSAQEDEGA
eukprot:g18860.t1